MAKYSKVAQKGVESAIKRMEKGKLRSGGSGKKVTDKKQAIAIGLSEAKKKGAKVPAKKAVVKKSAAKKSPLKKAASKKGGSKKPVAYNAPAKKVAVKKSFLKKAPAKKAAVKKSPLKKETLQSKTASAMQRSTAGKKNDANSSSNQPVTQKIAERPIENTVPAPIEDPIKTTDQNVYNKATSKMDPKHNMTVSSTRKGNIKPSGKKPLW
ncbi:MAG: DUF6496 domain-containing protein [Ferruginibacter sp.]